MGHTGVKKQAIIDLDYGLLPVGHKQLPDTVQMLNCCQLDPKKCIKNEIHLP